LSSLRDRYAKRLLSGVANAAKTGVPLQYQNRVKRRVG
jgi:hypothetical protein